jgi:hypothetical protein
MRAETREVVPAAPPAEKLAAESLVVQPAEHKRRLAEVGALRRSFAA